MKIHKEQEVKNVYMYSETSLLLRRYRRYRRYSRYRRRSSNLGVCNLAIWLCTVTAHKRISTYLERY
jgi:hypothetical protein